MCAIMDPSVPRYKIGGPDVMRGQLEHLIEMARRPTVAPHVVPDGAGPHPGLMAA